MGCVRTLHPLFVYAIGAGTSVMNTRDIWYQVRQIKIEYIIGASRRRDRTIGKIHTHAYKYNNKLYK